MFRHFQTVILRTWRGLVCQHLQHFRPNFNQPILTLKRRLHFRDIPPDKDTIPLLLPMPSISRHICPVSLDAPGLEFGVLRPLGEALFVRFAFTPLMLHSLGSGGTFASEPHGEVAERLNAAVC
jgi:hypothetical protein